jgi:hypothetical protein
MSMSVLFPCMFFDVKVADRRRRRCVHRCLCPFRHDHTLPIMQQHSLLCVLLMWATSSSFLFLSTSAFLTLSASTCVSVAAGEYASTNLQCPMGFIFPDIISNITWNWGSSSHDLFKVTLNPVESSFDSQSYTPWAMMHGCDQSAGTGCNEPLTDYTSYGWAGINYQVQCSNWISNCYLCYTAQFDCSPLSGDGNCGQYSQTGYVSSPAAVQFGSIIDPVCADGYSGTPDSTQLVYCATKRTYTGTFSGCVRDSDDSSNSAVIIGVSVSLSLVALSLLAVAVWWKYFRNRSAVTPISNSTLTTLDDTTDTSTTGNVNEGGIASKPLFSEFLKGSRKGLTFTSNSNVL